MKSDAAAKSEVIPFPWYLDLWSELDAAGFAVARLREIELRRVGLTIEQSAILDLLQNRGGSTSAKEIERLTLRQHHSISILVNRMVRLGLVSREKMPVGTGYRILISERGKRLFDELPMASVESVFRPIRKKERRQLATGLRSLHLRARQLLGMSYAAPFTGRALADTSESSMVLDNGGELSPSDYRLWSLLYRARFAIGRLRELEMAPLGLTAEQASILTIVKDSGGSTTSKGVEAETMRQHHSVSTLLNRMAKMGLLTKVRSSGGSRYALVLTEQGDDLARRMTTSALEMTFSTLADGEKQRLEACLRSIHRRVRRMLGLPKC